MSTFAWLIYFEQGPHDLNSLATALEHYGLAVTARGPMSFIVSDGRGSVRVNYNDRDFVRNEAQEMTTRVFHRDAREIAICGRRIELTWSAADAPEVTNILGFIEPEVQSLTTKCWIFDTWGRGAWL